MHKKLFFIIWSFVTTTHMIAQNTMRIHNIDGNHTDVPVAQIDSITFIVDDVLPVVAELSGNWLWGNVEQGYYELLTFNEDHTYTGYDNYFTYGFDTMTYGWWGQIGAMLTLQSNGYGYRRRYNWYITELTENALGVMTKMGPFMYYRLQSEVIMLRVGEEPLTCSGGDSFVFADGVVTKISDSKLLGLTKGMTYIQKYIAATESILAYKVIVE